jgi:hypothetical protein
MPGLLGDLGVGPSTPEALAIQGHGRGREPRSQDVCEEE